MQRKHFIMVVILLSLITGALHLMLHDRYRISYEDDVWSPGHAHTFVTTGLEIDRIFHTPSRKVIWTFGKTYDFVYGAFGSVFGWSRSSMHILSKLLVLMGALLWMGIVRRLGLGKELAVFFFFGLLLIEPLVSTMNISRKDALAFCLIALQLYLLLRGRFFESAFTAGVAFETHPMGSLAVFLSLGMIWLHRREWVLQGRWKRTLLLLSFGGAAGALYFILMLPENFSLPALLDSFSKVNVFSGFRMEYAWNNFLYVYLVHEKHYLQLAFYIICIGLFVWKRMWRAEQKPLVLFMVLFVASLVLRRTNQHYMTYATPVLLFFAFYTLSKKRIWLLLVPILYVSLAIGYVRKFEKLYPFSNGAMSARIRSVLPEDKLPIVGTPDLWFAFHDRPFFPTHFQDPWEELQLKEFYFIKDRWAKLYDGWFYKKAAAHCLSNATITPVAETVRIGDFRMQVVRVRKR